VRRALLRVLALFFALVALAALVRPKSAQAASDPSFRWYTIETEHFRITYHSGVEEVAQHVANVCEGIHGHMEESMGWSPKTKTEIVLQDVAESANGSASALPYNAIRLLVTAPEDLSPLGDVDDWYYELITHENTHVLHTDNIHGIPSLVNAVLGKTLAPNQVQPRWILEGYGVYMESAKTSAGRLRNSMWDMFMRTDVLEDNVASIDQISNTVRRWPQGNLFYLYGSYFITWIAETYGEDALRRMARDYGGTLIPWGINRTARRTTGRTLIDLYPAWIESMEKRYRAQAAEVRKQGIREGVRLTDHGQIARYPRWIPKNAWPEHQGGILYYREDQHYRPGLFAIDIVRDAHGNVLKADSRKADLVARTPTEAYATFLPDGSLVFNGAEPYRTVFLFNDLQKIAPGRKSPFGTPDGERTNLTSTKLRASDPTVSPDGRRIVFTQNHAGTRTIHIGDLQPDDVTNIRPLVPTAFLEQAFTPRWSPDGNFVAYSVWKRGGYRDLRLVDVRDGTSREITNDRATEGDPSFSADGRWLYFHSDRTGIMNVYAYELESGKLKQVTNVVTGAYSPDPSPDGKTLAYIGYGTKGFDLYAMRIDEGSWPDALPYVDTRPSPPQITNKRWPVKPYNAWPTLLPRRYGIQITPGNFGQAVIITASGTDISGIHAVNASTTTEIEKPELQGNLSYIYAQLPFDFSASMFRSITPRGGYAIGQFKPTVIQETVGFSSTIAYNRPGAYDTKSFALIHSVSRVGAELPMPVDKLDPYETPQFPSRGIASSLHFGLGYTNAERYLWSVGNERGYALSVAFDFTDPIIGSQFAGFSSNADFTTYFLMPWLRHHSLAVHTGAGTSGGSFPGRGAFFVGGLVDLPLIDTIRNVLIQGGFTLRGYAPVTLAGRSYTLFNTEYRFPIVNIDRGDETLPIFLNRITGNVFFDYGSAFDTFSDAQYKSGVGGELWFDMTLGYVAPFTFRLGYARGLASLGLDKAYFVAAVPY
jgi:hypothetical protein